MIEDEQAAARCAQLALLQITLDAAEEEARQLSVAYPKASVGRKVFREIADGISVLADRVVRR